MNRAGLVAAVRDREQHHADCPLEQRLIYACEDVCDAEMPSRRLDADEARAIVNSIAHTEDIDPPVVLVSRRLRRTLGAADIENRTLHLAGPPVSLLVLVHEMAHFTSSSPGHGPDFLHEMLVLTRTHIGVQHAAFLHSLFGCAGLAVPPWPAIVRR